MTFVTRSLPSFVVEFKMPEHPRRCWATEPNFPSLASWGHMTKPEAEEPSKEIFTLGKLFPDGSAIERLRDRQLVLWQNREEVIARTLSCQDRLYAAAPLDPKLEEFLVLPAGTADFGGVEDLVADLCLVITTRVGLDEESALLIASYILSTWVVDCLPSTVCLNPWGPAGSDTTLIELLSCVCRRTLRLAELSVRELASLPDDLCPTVILKQPSQRVLGQLLAVTGEPNVLLVRAGRLVNLRCATVACTQYPVSALALSISLLLSQTKDRISKADARQLSEEFQPRLLRYRVTQHLYVANSQFGVTGFAPQTRVLAGILGATAEGAPAVQTRIVEALKQLDEQFKSEQAQGLDAVVLEALLALCHENKSSARVLEVTEIANTILLGRHDHRELSPKAVGSILRNQLGLSTKRRGPGYELSLANERRARLHHLAAVHNVQSMLRPKADCPFCDGVPRTTATSLSVPRPTPRASTQSTQIHETGHAGEPG